MATKFFVCTTCGNVVVKFVDSGVTPFCCGKAMVELIPGTSDGAVEKHLPVVESVGKHTIRVKVGAMPHPMTGEHHISFICLETENGTGTGYSRAFDSRRRKKKLRNNEKVQMRKGKGHEHNIYGRRNKL